MDDYIFVKINRPLILKSIEDVDINKIENPHVIHNMKPPIYRGVWFPLGYE